jgi:GH15 family glucan-1,4-alpha-glucosidase
MMPLVGLLPPTDARVRDTVMAIERGLTMNGLVARYRTVPEVDGLPPGEATFLLCSFWLADNLHMLGRHDEARQLFERLLTLRNDGGLLSEGYDVGAIRLAGNFCAGVFPCRPDQHGHEPDVMARTGRRAIVGLTRDVVGKPVSPRPGCATVRV